MGVLVLRDAGRGSRLAKSGSIEKPVDMRLLTRKGKRRRLAENHHCNWNEPVGPRY